ncbi:MAG: hypothetical protein FWG63_01860 [Defluviitaleaceae bacterium]|nr:hypothetical protein [Defluviitaleaceae bacterium]
MENEILKQILRKLDKMENDMTEIKTDILYIKEDIADIKGDIIEMKEHAEITRNATNQLIEWADDVTNNAKAPFMDLSVVK